MRIATHKNSGLVAVVLLLALLVFGVRWSTRLYGSFRTHTPTSLRSISTLPPVMLWAWERPEDLEFIDPNKFGVAFLAKTVYLRNNELFVRPRQQLLRVSPNSALIAVIRIETDRRLHPILSRLQIEKVASEIVRCADLPNVRAVQIDFDATVSEREFYRKLVSEVRTSLPTNKGLSITALASWCAGDGWLADLPVDEAVPMLFRMGIEGQHFKSRLEDGYEFQSALCKSSAGVSTDERLIVPNVKRLYIFNPDSWSAESLTKAMETYKK